MAVKTKRSYKKKSYKKRAAKGTKYSPNAQRGMVTLGEGFPKMIKTTHRYCQTVRMINTSGSLAIQRFRSNGLFDPDYSSTGHQPLFYDQFATLYNKFHVIGSKISVTFIHTGSGVPTDCMVLVDDDVTTSSVVSTLMEQTNSKFKIMSYGNAAPKTVTRSYSAKKTHGGSILGNPSLQGDATNSLDPTEQNYFTIVTSPVDGTSNNNVDIVVKIEYVTIWTDLKEVSGS